jgi:protein-tyrosine phosphatase
MRFCVSSKGRHRTKLWRLLVPLVFVAAVHACSSDGESLGGAETPDDSKPQNPCEGDFSVGPAPARRLSRAEFANTLNDLFGTSAGAASELPDDTIIDGYDNSSGNTSLSQLTADRIFSVNEALAAIVTTDLSALLPCAPAAIDVACLDSFIRTTGQRAYRHPLSDQEVAILRGVYDANADATTQERLGLLLRAMLFAPQMLYRFESGDPNLSSPAPAYVALSGFEVATRLSYLVWAGPPDEALLSAAGSGALATAQGIENQLREMLGDTRARRGMLRFLSQWIDLRGLDDFVPDAATYPQFTPALLDAMREQTVRFLEAQVIDGDASVADLLTADAAPMNPILATLYGVDHPTGEGWASVTLPSTERRGFLTHASFLASKAHSATPSPVQRGLYVRARLLCQDIPDPPDDVDTTIEETTEAVTNRQRFEQHLTDPGCRGCHQWMDPIGFGLENFDSIGAFRSLDHGLPIDASGEIVFADDANRAFNGAIELSEQLAASKQVAACMADQVFRFSQGRRPEPQDACSMDRVFSRVATSGDAIKELMVAVAVSDSFRFKPAEASTSSTGEQP